MNGRSTPRFLLGVGAQKAGTTWLHQYLGRSPRVDFGFVKEYHVFDALFIDDPVIRQAYLQRRINDIVDPTRVPGLDQLRLLRFLGDPAAYFDHFEKICRRRPIELTGDMTPSYAGLPTEALRFIRAQLEQRGFAVRVVFLMRDPVERCISSVRMRLRLAQAERTRTEEEATLAELYASPGQQMRTRYDLTIERLESAFDASQIHYGFYETLFETASVRRICDFLAIPYLEPDFDKRVNVSRTDHAVSEPLRATVARAYEPVYRFVAAKFGHEWIERLWPSSRYVRPGMI